MRNVKMTGNAGRRSITKKTGPPGETFSRQTGIAWLPDGTLFATDGDAETRGVKFDKNGKFLSQWYLGDGPTATYHRVMIADQHLWASDGHGNFKFYKYGWNGRLLSS